MLVLETDTYGQEDVPKLWLVNTLRKIGYTFREIFHVYDALFEDKRPPFHHREGQVFLLDRLTELLKSWLTEASQFDR